eukprot:1161233-Pelagomonas_calceolata.AAC.9
MDTHAQLDGCTPCSSASYKPCTARWQFRYTSATHIGASTQGWEFPTRFSSAASHTFRTPQQLTSSCQRRGGNSPPGTQVLQATLCV